MQSATLLQFEMFSALVQEIQEMNAKLGQFVMDFAAKQELAGGLVKISQGPCRICGHASTHHMRCRAGWLTVHTTVLCFQFNSPTLCPLVPYHYP